MKSRRLASFMLALSLTPLAAAAPALAQAACTPEKLNAAMDGFAKAPFGAAS